MPCTSCGAVCTTHSILPEVYFSGYFPGYCLWCVLRHRPVQLQGGYCIHSLSASDENEWVQLLCACCGQVASLNFWSLLHRPTSGRCCLSFMCEHSSSHCNFVLECAANICCTMQKGSNQTGTSARCFAFTQAEPSTMEECVYDMPSRQVV